MKSSRSFTRFLFVLEEFAVGITNYVIILGKKYFSNAQPVTQIFSLCIIEDFCHMFLFCIINKKTHTCDKTFCYASKEEKAPQQK